MQSVTLKKNICDNLKLTRDWKTDKPEIVEMKEFGPQVEATWKYSQYQIDFRIYMYKYISSNNFFFVYIQLVSIKLSLLIINWFDAVRAEVVSDTIFVWYAKNCSHRTATILNSNSFFYRLLRSCVAITGAFTVLLKLAR